MKKTVLSEFFVYEFPFLDFYIKEKKVDPVLEIKNTKNNTYCQDIYNNIQKDRYYYGKKRRYYSDYI